jgi:hypothetical protein
MSTPVTILVNQKPHHLDSPDITPEKLRELAGLPQDYEVWRVVGSPDPDGQLPKDDVQITSPITVQNGERFRVVPPGTFGVAAREPMTLAQELKLLERDGFDVETANEPDSTVLVFKTWKLPRGYNKTQTRLLLRIPKSYPLGKPDMFWTDPDLRLENGGTPRQTSGEQILGEPWLRFSWHSSKWDPAVDNLRSFLAFVETGLVKARS